MTVARKEIVFDSTEGIYHCINRCVRRAFLTGDDQYTHKNYDYRREWIHDRLVQLSLIFTVDICGFAVMSNHLHVILRNRPDLRDALTDRDVAERWRRLYPRHFPEAAPQDAREQDILRMLAAPERLQLLRERLGSISWFMKSLSEPIAKRANQEDHCKGRFWEGRFKCQALLDDAAVLACMAYVDLNPIRASLAKTPEGSDFTSVHEHLEARQAARHVNALKARQSRKAKPLSDYQKRTLVAELEHTHADDWLCPIEDSPRNWRLGIHGLLGMTLDDYLELLDWTGRCIRSGKRGVIPATLKPILERLRIDTVRWVDTVLSFSQLFHRVIGHVDELVNAAARAGKRWFQGSSACHAAFPDGSPG